MRKILTVAAREYKAMVGTKAFLVSIIMMPILMGGSVIAMQLLKNIGEVKERRIIVADQSGILFERLKSAAEVRNQFVEKMAKAEESNDSAGQEEDDPFGSTSKGEIYRLENFADGVVDDQKRVEFSNQIRNGSLYAFVEIPASATEAAPNPDAKVLFYSQDSSIANARSWFALIINDLLKTNRLKAAGIDPKVVAAASFPIRVSGMGLVQAASDGSVAAAKEKNEMADIFLPLGTMMFMFMCIFMASQPMLESVLEEKSQRIAEVLLGSASPFQIMSGKLIGTVGGSLTVFLIYLGGMLMLAKQRGWMDSVPLELIPWFVVFQILGVLFFASIFMAVGASVSQLKEAQTMLLPVWMLLMLPMFIWIIIVREPNGTVATWVSFFPPATSTTMMLRLATGQTIAMWQIVLACVILIVATIMVVILAGRIFRVGMLWQGKVPKLTELLRWAITG